MNSSRFKWTLYLIVMVISITIAIQVYWNYRNYQTNKQQLVNDVQAVLDNSVASYYELLAKESTIGFSFEEGLSNDFFDENGEFDSIVKKIDKEGLNFSGLDSITLKSYEGVRVFRGLKADSLLKETHNPIKNKPIRQLQIEDHTHFPNDSLTREDFEMLTSKVIISISSDTLNLKAIDSIVSSELVRKNIDVDFRLMYKSPDSLISSTREINSKNALQTASSSTFLPANSSLQMDFSNVVLIILKRILLGILISSLLVLAVISSLFYLLRIIKSQKHLAEVKNDLISNITHEFKTPIATIGVALESIQNFDTLNDKEKTKSYLKMSAEQLNKLNVMVEKLLETATLDRNSIALSKERVDLIKLMNELISRYRIAAGNKVIQFNHKPDELEVEVDCFHFESAISNLIDNAVKYGGNSITIFASQGDNNGIEIRIHDNGKKLSPKEKNKIFDKFYRVSKGNTHDVKGFGIGLYYTKTIVEKHGGSVALNIDNTGTTFIIRIP
ncbi:MAG: HAMP domain-containing histidine kinase [Bacteroidia bacterium]|nr:HAMP domain-containing histidine kinase [Bacteroidia bacterium]